MPEKKKAAPKNTNVDDKGEDIATRDAKSKKKKSKLVEAQVNIDKDKAALESAQQEANEFIAKLQSWTDELALLLKKAGIDPSSVQGYSFESAYMLRKLTPEGALTEITNPGQTPYLQSIRYKRIVSTPVIVVCECGRKNRVDLSKPRIPVCGICRKELGVVRA